MKEPRFRRLFELVNFGIALKDRLLKGLLFFPQAGRGSGVARQSQGEEEGPVARQRHDSKALVATGWPELKQVEVHFKLPREVKEETCRLKPGRKAYAKHCKASCWLWWSGENVVISLGDPDARTVQGLSQPSRTIKGSNSNVNALLINLRRSM